ncbi:YfhO family protein, partial [Lactiplantibacillus pentosus]
LPNLVLNSDGMPFWVILGISGLTWLAILHSLRHFKQRWDLNSLLIILLVGLLLPAVAAVFNVLSSPSNRWLLLSALLFSVLTMRLIDDWKELDSSDYRLFLGASIGLIIVIWI